MTLKKLLKIYNSLDSKTCFECEEKRASILMDVLKDIHEKIRKKVKK